MGNPRSIAYLACLLGIFAVLVALEAGGMARYVVDPPLAAEEGPRSPTTPPVREGSVTSLYSAETPRQIAAMLGAHVRLVWLRAHDWREVRRSHERSHVDEARFDVTLATPSRDPELLEPAARIEGGGKDADIPQVGRWIDRQGAFAIMALDTDEGRECELVATGRLYNPLILPDGQQVVYSRDDPATGRWSMSAIAWEGGGSRVLGQGYALWVWPDPATGRSWIYASDQPDASAGVWRYAADDPARREPVYAGTASRWFSLSRDGGHAAGCFPWPVVGALSLPSGILDMRGFREGCNAYIAPDDSYLISVLNGAHNGLTIYAPGQTGIETSLVPPLMKRTQLGGPGKMWNPKWAGDAHHVLVCGPIRPTTSDAAELWLGAYASDYRSIRQWIQVTHSDYCDTSAHLWCDPGLGDRRGPAPLAIVLPGLAAGGWRVDFGDGSPADGAATTHTYARPGVYAISARRGAELRQGRVTVEARHESAPVAAYRRGAHEVEIRFAQAPTGADLQVRSSSGDVAVFQGTSSDGLRLFCSFAEAIRPSCQLSLSRTTASALEPAGGVAIGTIAVALQPWPSDLTELAFAWANARGDNCWYCSGRFSIASLIRHGAARIDRDGALLCAGGSYEARLDDGIRPWSQPDLAQPATALSCELTLRLRDASAAGPADIVRLGPPPPGGLPIVVECRDRELCLKLGGKALVIGRIADQARHQVAFSVRDATATAFFDGAPVGTLTGSGAILPGPGPLELAGGGWHGSLEGVAVYRRALTEQDLAVDRRAYTSMIAGIGAVKSRRIQAQLTARSQLPALAEIRPYRDALVVCEYDTNSQNSTLGTKVYVAQWGIVDGTPTALAGLALGSVYALELEDIAEHPELESAWLSDTVPHLPSTTIFVEAGR